MYFSSEHENHTHFYDTSKRLQNTASVQFLNMFMKPFLGDMKF